jgi:hypothetical protein
MMKLIFNFLLMLKLSGLMGAQGLSAFTLIYSDPPRYRGAVEIVIIGNDCSNINLTKEVLRDDVIKAVGAFWNTVPTSTLRFVVRPEYANLADNLLIAEMVSEVGENKILIGCTTNTSVFNSTKILAGTRMVDADIPRAVIAINNIQGSSYSKLSAENRRSTMAHEIGHALGLGHTNHMDALMYYATSDGLKVKYLSLDDADGVSYLYPKKSKFIGLLSGCGLIKDSNRPGPSSGGGNLSELLQLFSEIFLLTIIYKLWRKISFKRWANFILSR